MILLGFWIDAGGVSESGTSWFCWLFGFNTGGVKYKFSKERSEQERRDQNMERSETVWRHHSEY